MQEQESIQEEINALLENEAVKKYLVLIVKKDILDMECDFLYSEMKYDEYASCKHILINLTDAFGRKFLSRLY